jgi:branched-chain amino acid transport system substrate-binding protein
MSQKITRRTLIKTTGGLLGATALSTVSVAPAFAAGRTIKIGVVSPDTGPMAAFAEPTEFVLSEISKALGGNVKINGVDHPFEFIVKDTQSSPNRASEVALELIQRHQVDIILCYGGPETANPASDQCELNGVPCIASDLPIEPWFFGRGGDPKVGFDWTYCAFFDSGTYANAMLSFMSKIENNKVVGGLWPNDADGIALSQAFTEMPTARSPSGATEAGYSLDLPAITALG